MRVGKLAMGGGTSKGERWGLEGGVADESSGNACYIVSGRCLSS